VKAYELKVTLQGIRPLVWRRVKVRSDITLEDLHRVLRVVMGWTDSHMHAFRSVGRGAKVRTGSPAVERDQERRTRLDELLRKPKERMVYEYDFGDSWEHEVLLERVVDDPAGARYPWVLEGARACPPEDVGGVGGYASFLQAMRDARHPEHDEMLEWHGGAFDPAAFDAQALNRIFHGGWAPEKLDG
jgi:Plasmid pRiA4b ORF-3-like protein